MRQSVLFMGATQIFESCCAGERHLRFLISDFRFSISSQKQLLGNAKKLFPRFPSRSQLHHASHRSKQLYLAHALPVRGTPHEHARKTPPPPAPFDLVDAASAFASSRWPHRRRGQKSRWECNRRPQMHSNAPPSRDLIFAPLLDKQWWNQRIDRQSHTCRVQAPA